MKAVTKRKNAVSEGPGRADGRSGRTTVNSMDFSHPGGLGCSGRVPLTRVFNDWQITDTHKIFSGADD